MRTAAQILSGIALAGTIIPAILYLGGGISLPALTTWMLVSTVVWFVTVPVWMDRADGSGS